MRIIVLSIITVVLGFMVSCDDHDVLPPYNTPPVIFNVTTMTHVRDTIAKQGDTLKFNVTGYVSDTITKYAIGITLKAVDSVTQVQVSGSYMKTFKLKYDTVGFYKTNMIRFTNADTNSIYMTTPALPAGTKIRSSASFTYGLNLSSQLGTTTAAVTRNGYTK
jgi:hypothetical protein